MIYARPAYLVLEVRGDFSISGRKSGTIDFIKVRGESRRACRAEEMGRMGIRAGV